MAGHVRYASPVDADRRQDSPGIDAARQPLVERGVPSFDVWIDDFADALRRSPVRDRIRFSFALPANRMQRRRTHYARAPPAVGGRFLRRADAGAPWPGHRRKDLA